MDFSLGTILVGALIVGLLVLFGIALVQISGDQALGAVERVAWTLVVLLIPYLGAAGWFFYGRTGIAKSWFRGAGSRPKSE